MLSKCEVSLLSNFPLLLFKLSMTALAMQTMSRNIFRLCVGIVMKQDKCLISILFMEY